jgi:putative colanic acid biosynthesis acetyltransferase WcaF
MKADSSLVAKCQVCSPFSLGQRLRRLTWSVAWSLLGRPFPRACFGWRRGLLGLFGARVDATARVYGTVKIWAPWNLVMGPGSILGADVDCYNVATITLEEGATVSQYAYLCTAGYDIRDVDFPLITAPIVVRAKAWVCAKAVVGMGVTLGEGAVVALGAVVVKSVGPWTIVGGNPAREIGQRHQERIG